MIHYMHFYVYLQNLLKEVKLGLPNLLTLLQWCDVLRADTKILLMTTLQMRWIKGHFFMSTIGILHLRTCLERGFNVWSSYLMLIFKYVGSQYFILENQVIVHAFHQKSWLYYIRKGILFISNWIKLLEIG